MIVRIRAKVIRVYFNQHGDLAKVWSLDTGAGTREYMVGDVQIEGLEVVFQYDPTVTDPEQGEGMGSGGGRNYVSKRFSAFGTEWGSHMSTVILIDGGNALWRFGYVHQRLSTEDGIPTGALYGFIGCLMRLKRHYPDARFAVAWDGGRLVPEFARREYPDDGWKNWRTKLLPGYKVRDGAPDEMRKQILGQRKTVSSLCKLIGIPEIMVSGIEADDLLAILATKLMKVNMQPIIYSMDKDFCQLMVRGVKVIRDVDKTVKLAPESEKTILASFGCKVENVLKVRAFLGDSSDKIPVAVRGVGPKAAVQLVEVLGVDPSVDHPSVAVGVVNGNKLKIKAMEGWPAVRRNYKLMELVTDVSDPRLGELRSEVKESVKSCLVALLSSPVRDYRALVFFLSEMEMADALEARHSLYKIQLISA